jgi:hypothetical protein
MSNEVAKELGTEIHPKPKCKLLGANGNIFNLMAIAGKALQRAGLEKEKKEMIDSILNCASYDKALQTIMDYVEVE